MGHVIAERQPIAALALLLLPGEDTGIGPVDIGQELAQSLDRLNRGGFQRIKTMRVIDARDLVQHLLAFQHLGAEIIAEAFGRLGLGAGLFTVFGHRWHIHALGVVPPLAEGGVMGKPQAGGVRGAGKL